MEIYAWRMLFIKKIDISNFNTDKINDISYIGYMLFKCFSLEKNYFPKIKKNNNLKKNMCMDIII